MNVSFLLYRIGFVIGFFPSALLAQLTFFQALEGSLLRCPGLDQSTKQGLFASIDK